MKKGVIFILSALAGAAIGAGTVGKVTGRAAGRIQEMSDKHLALFLLMNQWLQVKQEGRDLAIHLEKNGYHNVAIYGMSYVGERLLEELKESSISVKYGIDKKADGLYSNIDIVSPDGELEEVDAIIVTPVFFMNEIVKTLAGKVSCPVISLEDLLYEV